MTDRKRSPNWQMTEKILLVDLVTEHFHIVENKRTDAVTMKQKNAEWVKISHEFNSQTNFGHRTAENFKAQWESLKISTKKESAAARQSMIQTGGGPAKPKSDDPLYTRILGLISTAVAGLVNKYDCDNFVIEENRTLSTVNIPDVSGIFVSKTTATKSTPIALDNDDANYTHQDIADWGDYTPQMLQTQKSAPLRAQSAKPIAKPTPLALDIDDYNYVNNKLQGDCANLADYTTKMLQSQKSAPQRTQSVQPITEEDVGNHTKEKLDQQTQTYFTSFFNFRRVT